MLGKKISVRKDATRRSAPYELIERIRRHFVGRVMTLAAATAFAATLSLVLLPLTTRQLELSDYGTYGLLVSIVALVGAATDGGASLLVPAHYGLASAAERARLFSSLAIFTGIGASIAGLLLIILWALATRHFLGSGDSLGCNRALGRSDADAGNHQYFHPDILSDRPRAGYRRTNGSPISGRIPQHTHLPARI